MTSLSISSLACLLSFAPAPESAPTPMPTDGPTSGPTSDIAPIELGPAAPEGPQPASPGTSEPTPGPEFVSPFDMPSGTSAAPPPPSDIDGRSSREVATVTQSREPRAFGPDRPMLWRFDLSASGGTASVFTRSYTAMDSDRSLGHGELAFRFDHRLGAGKVFLGAGATWRAMTTTGNLHDAISPDTAVNDVIGALRLTVRPLDGIDAYLDAGAGPAFVAIHAFEKGEGTGTADQKSVVAVVSPMVGTQLSLPKKWLMRKGAARVTGGLDLGLGYVWHSPIEWHPELALDDNPIDTQTASFGHIKMHGPTWRLGLFLRFM